MSPSCIWMHQPTPMRRIPMAPCWIMIGFTMIPMNAMIACNNVATQSHGALRFNTTCLLAFSTLIWTSECSISWLWSTSWILTRRALALAFLLLYCWRVLTFRLCFKWLPGTATKIGMWYVGGSGSLRMSRNSLVSGLMDCMFGMVEWPSERIDYWPR